MTPPQTSNNAGELIVVGGGTRGLGLAIYQAFKARGFNANLFHRQPAENKGKDCTHIPFNLDEETAFDVLKNDLNKIFRSKPASRFSVHVLTGGSLGVKLGKASQDEISRVFLHNALLPMMAAQELYNICTSLPSIQTDIFFYSTAATQTYNSTPYYVASKSAIESFFKAFVKCAPRNISAFLLRLGHVDIKHKYFHQLSLSDPGAFAEYINKAVPTEHFTSTEEIAEFCVHLSSNQGMLKGMMCDVTGGHSWV